MKFLKNVTPGPLHIGTGISTVKMAAKFEIFFSSIEFVQELKQPRLEVLDDLGEVLNDLDIAPTASDQPPISTMPTPSNANNVNNKTLNRSTGRPCELCGFEPKTKNKSRERQDHLAMKHYRERIQADLTASTNFSCPMCDYVGKDKQTIYRYICFFLTVKRGSRNLFSC